MDLGLRRALPGSNSDKGFPNGSLTKRLTLVPTIRRGKIDSRKTIGRFNRHARRRDVIQHIRFAIREKRDSSTESVS